MTRIVVSSCITNSINTSSCRGGRRYKRLPTRGEIRVGTTACPPYEKQLIGPVSSGLGITPLSLVWQQSHANFAGSQPCTIQQPVSLPLADLLMPDQSMGRPAQNHGRVCGAEKPVAHLFHTPGYRRATRRTDSSHGWKCCHFFWACIRKI